MIFYKYTYTVKQVPKVAFNYFLQKSYLTRFFTDDDGTIAIQSTFPEDPLIRLNETITIASEDDEDVTTIHMDVISIEKFAKIKMRMRFGYVEDQSAELDFEEEEEMNDFMGKLLGDSCFYTIDFIPQKNGQLKIVELSEVNNIKFVYKIFWKIYGWYLRISQRGTHKEVQKEIELL